MFKLKRLIVFSILFFCVLGIMAMPKGTGNTYGGLIFFRNVSSYNLYFEFDVADNQFSWNRISRFSLEKREAIIEGYAFFVPFADENNFNIDSAYPNNYFINIRIYNMDTGALLTEINPSDMEIFVLKEGNIENDDAIITLIIDDSLF